MDDQPMIDQNIMREPDFGLPGETPEIEPPLQPDGEQQPRESTNNEGVEVRRSGRMRKPPSKYQDYITNDQELMQAIQASTTTIMKERNPIASHSRHYTYLQKRIVCKTQ